MIRRLIDLILDVFPIYLEPLDVSVPPDMQHLLDQAMHALDESEGLDLGPLTHAERNKLLFGE